MTESNEPKPTIEERLEAITHTLELVSQMQLKTEERVDAITHTLELVSQMQLKTDQHIKRLGRYVRIIVVDHEQRLAALEGDDEEDEN